VETQSLIDEPEPSFDWLDTIVTMPLRCRLCDSELTTGLVATGRRACCLNATGIVGICPEHGPLGPYHAVEA